MVISKKCKVCTALDANNIAISGVYYDKSLPDLIEKISGIKLDPRKANAVLICKLCATQLLHTDVFIDKLRSTLQRLTKLVKETKPKTPSKDSTEDKPKLKSKNNLAKSNSDFLDHSLVKIEEELKQTFEASESLTNPKKIEDELNTNTPKCMIRRKSVIRNNEEKNIQNGGAEGKVSTTKFKKVLDTEVASKNVDSNLNEHNKGGEEGTKTSKNAEIPRDNLPHHMDDLQQNGDQANNISTTRFKKIVDDVTHVKEKQAKADKRKKMFKENEVESTYLKKSSIFESTPVKRNKTVSISEFEKNSIDFATDKHNFTGSCNEKPLAEVKMKSLNCVICGKGFYQKASLREHIESSHNGEKLKQCPICSAEFRSRQKYDSHVLSEKCKNSRHTCHYPKCNRRYKTVSKLELHMQEKHFSPQQKSEVE